MQSPQEHNLRAFYLLEWLQFRTLVFVPYCACWLDETSDSRKIRHLVTVSSLIGFKEIGSLIGPPFSFSPCFLFKCGILILLSSCILLFSTRLYKLVSFEISYRA